MNAAAIPAVLVFAFVGCGLASRSEREEHMEYEKRAPIPEVAPVTQGGTRYEPVTFERSEGLDQNSGYIAAVDQATGKRKWVVKVYDVSYDTDLESDLQDVFITSLELSPDGKQLYIVNEEERRFAVDLTDRTVKELQPVPATSP
jgi:hypothetical protein